MKTEKRPQPFQAELEELSRPFRPDGFEDGAGMAWAESRPATPQMAVDEIVAVLLDVAHHAWADGSRFGADYPPERNQPYNTWPLMAYHQATAIRYDKPCTGGTTEWWAWPTFRCNIRSWVLRACDLVRQCHQRWRNQDEAWPWVDRMAKAVSRLVEAKVIVE